MCYERREVTTQKFDVLQVVMLLIQYTTNQIQTKQWKVAKSSTSPVAILPIFSARRKTCNASEQLDSPSKTSRCKGTQSVSILWEWSTGNPVSHGIPWDTMGYHGIPWDTMGYHGIPWDTINLSWWTYDHPRRWVSIYIYIPSFEHEFNTMKTIVNPVVNQLRQLGHHIVTPICKKRTMLQVHQTALFHVICDKCWKDLWAAICRQVQEKCGKNNDKLIQAVDVGISNHG